MSKIEWLRFVKDSIPPFFYTLSAHSHYTKVPRLSPAFSSLALAARPCGILMQ